jgi:transposase
MAHRGQWSEHEARGVLSAWRKSGLGRKNYLFVGDVDAGMSVAGLYTLVATCEARGINPFAYLSDVIPRVQDHPRRRLDELLPGPWSRAQAST